MMRFGWWFALAACASQEEVKTEVEVDTRPLIEPEFVMSEIELLDSDEGFDLDNDGTPDNGLALLFEDPYIGPALGGDPNEYIAKSIRRAELLLLLDFRNFQGYSDDAAVDIDIFLGHDPDGDKDNNFDGEEFTVTCSSLTEDNTADSQFLDASIQDGILYGENGSFRFLVSFSNTEVLLQDAKITGTFDAEGNLISDGLIGGAVTYADLEEVVLNDPEIGPSFADAMLAFLANKLDVDLDGNGEVDALSASFRFQAVPAFVDRESECAE